MGTTNDHQSPVSRLAQYGPILIAAVMFVAAGAKVWAVNEGAVPTARMITLRHQIPWFAPTLDAAVWVSAGAEICIGALLLTRYQQVALAFLVPLCSAWCLVLASLDAMGLAPTACKCFGAAMQVTYPAHYAINASIIGLAGLCYGQLASSSGAAATEIAAA